MGIRSVVRKAQPFDGLTGHGLDQFEILVDVEDGEVVMCGGGGEDEIGR